MNQNVTAIQYMGMIMRLETLNIDYVLNLVQLINNSFLSAKDVVTILQEIFKNQKSGKILLATQVLEYLVKNSNRNFHQAANKESFQKSILGLLKRQRGKMNLIKELRSNTENWARIQSRILYLIQLWYDAFILQQSKYPNIINNYKILRKQNVVFPPRNVNERSLLAIKTQSPIFDNIQTIAEADKQKFKKRLKAMGLSKLSQKFQQKQHIMKNEKRNPVSRDINIDQISQKIAIIQSQDYEAEDVFKVIEQVKQAIQFGKVKSNQQPYWKQVKQAAYELIQQWQQKNAKFIQQKQQKYLQQKMNGKIKKIESQQEKSEPTPNLSKFSSQKVENKKQFFDLLGDEPNDNKKTINAVDDLLNLDDGKNNAVKQQKDDEWGDFGSTQQEVKKGPQQFNLLDL